ncbi:MAG: hypothetical protein WDO69_02810 [Pseudomonadota bacterium]
MSYAAGASYAALVHRIPKLSKERERKLVERWRERADEAARDELVRSQLRRVVAVARSYRRDVPWDIGTEDAHSACFLEVHELPALDAEETALSKEAGRHLSAPFRMLCLSSTRAIGTSWSDG